MLVATCVIKLNLDGVNSLKEKRRIVKSVVTRLPQEFNVTAAEIDYHDYWQTAAIGLAAIGTDAGHLHSLLQKTVAWLEKNRPDVQIEAYSIEFR